MKEPEMKLIAGFIARVLQNRDNEGKIKEVREGVKALCDRFPLYQGRIEKGKAELQ
jgi:glycine hydroxymethyltransferase